MSAYPRIDEVEPSPKFGVGGPAGWRFALWSNLEYKEARHRELLERFAAAHEGFVLTLPNADPDEEVVMGSLRWDSGDVLVYFETILSHVSLWSADREALEELRALIVPLASTV